jgi:hypothetical protein
MRSLYLCLSAPVLASALFVVWLNQPAAHLPISNALQLFAALLVGHVIADYPLQGDFLSRAKNRFNPLPGVPWYQALGAHMLIHAGVVWLITGIWWLGVLELVCHAAIDDTKCRGAIGFNTDQALHVLCKVLWTLVVVAVLS